jgi:hypothetical protein
LRKCGRNAQGRSERGYDRDASQGEFHQVVL